MTVHLKWSFVGAGAVGMLIALTLGGMLAVGVGNEEGLFGGSPLELLLWWMLLAVMTTASSAALLTAPTLLVRLASSFAVPASFRASVEFAIAVSLGLVVAHFLTPTYADGARDSLTWYFLLFSIPGAILAANVLQGMTGEAECAS